MSKEEPFVSYTYEIKNLSSYIKTLRIIFGISLDELATILQTTRTTLAKYENGENKITPIIFLAIRGVLFDIAERVEDEKYYKLIWLLFIEDVSIQPIEQSRITSIKNDIVITVNSYYDKRTRKLPTWMHGLQLQTIIQDKYPELF